MKKFRRSAGPRRASPGLEEKERTMPSHNKLVINDVELSVYQSRKFEELMNNSPHFQRRFGKMVTQNGGVRIKKKK